MLTLMKRALLTGAGLAALGKDKLDQIAQEMIAVGEISEKQGERMVACLRQAALCAESDLAKMIRRTVEKSLHGMNVATMEDIRRLERKMKSAVGGARRKK